MGEDQKVAMPVVVEQPRSTNKTFSSNTERSLQEKAFSLEENCFQQEFSFSDLVSVDGNSTGRSTANAIYHTYADEISVEHAVLSDCRILRLEMWKYKSA